jgi:flagellar protein FliL
MNHYEGEIEPRAGERLYGVLKLVAIILVLAIAGGTGYALLRGPKPKHAEAQAAVEGGPSYFAGIGEVRCKTADKAQAAVIVRLSLPYDSSDPRFTEELVKKSTELHDVAVSFFASKTVADLHPSKEAALKTALRDELNKRLIVGKLHELLFTEFAVIP